MQLTLIRTAQSDKGTFGVLVIDNKPVCVTCEDPWNNNQRQISCIPTGVYDCVKFNGSKYKNVWQVLNVPNRDAILIHNGNDIRDTQGCILVGQGFFQYEGNPAITNSRATLDLLRATLPDNFKLTIKEAF